MRMRDKLPLEEWMEYYTQRIQPSYSDWDIVQESIKDEEELGSVGSMAVGTIDRLLTVKELVDGIIRDAEEILESWQFLKTR